MYEILEENIPEEELKRADHLVYVSLKYTRTTDIMLNAMKRMIAAFELSMIRYLEFEKKNKKISTIPLSKKERTHLVKDLLGTSVSKYLMLYFLLKKIEKKEIREAIYSHETGTMVIPASISYENLKNSNLSSLPKIIEELKSQADFIILDCAAGLDKEVKETLKAANEILIVTNPELPAVTDALKTIRLCQDLKRDILGIVVNKTNVKNKDMKIEAILDVLEKEIIGIIPEDKYIKEALAEKQPVVYSYPKSASAIQYKKLAANILGIEYDEKLPKDINSGNIFDAILRFLNIKE